MENFSSNGISSQLIIIFTLVLVVGLLLVVIIFLDKKEKLKKKKNDYEEDYDDNFTFEDLYQKDSSKEEELIELESSNKIIEEDKNESIQENLTPYTENLLKEEPKVLEEVKTDEILIPKLNKINETIDNFKPLEEEKIDIISTNDIEVKEPFVEEEIYIDEELEKTQAQLELKKLTEELEKAANEENNIGLTTFELEQEENAIISLEELTKLSDKLYDENESTQYSDEGDEPITIDQLKEKFKKEEVIDKPIIEEKEEYKQVTLDDFITIDKKDNNIEPFKSSPIISPVYGIEQMSLKDELKLEDPEINIEEANRDELEIEMRKTSEFLQTLKELRKNLE